MIESLGKSIICNALMIKLKILFDSMTVPLSRQIQCVKFIKPPKKEKSGGYAWWGISRDGYRCQLKVVLAGI